MAQPTDTTPLRLAVVHALTSATGKPRSLGLDGYPLFREAGPAESLQRGSANLDRPGVTVAVRDHGPDPDALMFEMSNLRREVCVVEVRCSYASGNPAVAVEINATLAAIERDRQRVLAALLYPDALLYAPDGQETGLDSGCLRWDGYTSQGPEPWPLPQGERVLRVTHRFRVSVELTSA